ncbi:hypothetical protein FB005_101545 [Sinorhizobium medicae]|nr:hypothetical protein FB005_101545 [Sinorhizobium medicae]
MSFAAFRLHPALFCSSQRVGGFDIGVEFSGVFALLARTVGGSLAAAERHVEVDTRRGQVEHHHAGLGIALEVRRVFQAGGGDTRRQTEGRVIGDGQRFIVIPDADDGCDRSEDFLAGDTHIVRRLGEQPGCR